MYSLFVPQDAFFVAQTYETSPISVPHARVTICVIEVSIASNGALDDALSGLLSELWLDARERHQDEGE